jgi:predicted phosphodiesterase
MIWVIGDIHGSKDLLDAVLDKIREREKSKKEKVEKIIFLGDYIDRGPDSKGVMDTIINLKYDKICLSGNHEEMALRFMYMDCDSRYRSDFGIPWLYNHSEVTYKSIYLNTENEHKSSEYASMCFHCHGNDSKIKYEDFLLPTKYENFLKNLSFSHQESFKCSSGDINFSFFHSLPRWDEPLEEQRKIKTFSEYFEYTEEDRPYFYFYTHAKEQLKLKNYQNRFRITHIPYDGTFIWLRQYSVKWGYGSDVIIHGHSPVLAYGIELFCDREIPSFKSQLKYFRPELGLPFLWTRARGAGFKFRGKAIKKDSELTNELEFNCGKSGAVEAINIDTGAVFKGALTAAGLSAETLEKNEIELITAFHKNHKLFPGLTAERTIKTNFDRNKPDDRDKLWALMEKCKINFEADPPKWRTRR